MSDTILCEDILQNIKQSLNYCCYNKELHKCRVLDNKNKNLEKEKEREKFIPSECPNIVLFQKQQLVATKTKIVYNTPIIDIHKQYSIEYDVGNRQIIIDQ